MAEVSITEGQLVLDGEIPKDEKGNPLFADFAFRCPLGNGANAQVFLAENTKLGRNEAIKLWILSGKESGRWKGALEKARREAEKNAKIATRSVAQIYDIGECRSPVRFFYARMEYVNGIPLKNLFSEIGKIMESAAAADPSCSDPAINFYRQRCATIIFNIAQSVFKELFYIHSQDIVHGDLNLGNIMVETRQDRAARKARSQSSGNLRPFVTAKEGRKSLPFNVNCIEQDRYLWQKDLSSSGNFYKHSEFFPLMSIQEAQIKVIDFGTSFFAKKSMPDDTNESHAEISLFREHDLMVKLLRTALEHFGGLDESLFRFVICTEERNRAHYEVCLHDNGLVDLPGLDAAFRCALLIIFMHEGYRLNGTKETLSQLNSYLAEYEHPLIDRRGALSLFKDVTEG